MVHGLNYYHGSAATLANTPYDGVLETLYQHHLSQALAGIGKKKNSKVVQVEFCNLPQNVSFTPQQHYKHEHHGEAMQISPQQQACVDHSMEANSALAFETFFQDLEQAPTMISMMMGRPNAITPQQQQHANLVQQQHQHAHMHHEDEDCDEDEDSMGSGSPNSQKISPGNSPQEKSAVDQFLSQALTMTGGNRRANFACSECRKSHKACSGGRPCERCVKLGLSDSCRDISRKKRCVTKKHWHKFMGSANIKEQIMKVQQEFVTKCSQEQKSAQNSPRDGRRTSISAAGSSC